MEFRKMVDHPGILQDSILALLSHLYLGRAQLMMEDKVAARKGGPENCGTRFLCIGCWVSAFPD